MQETAAVPIWHFSSQHKLLETLLDTGIKKLENVKKRVLGLKAGREVKEGNAAL